jgi:hypothetical protein
MISRKILDQNDLSEEEMQRRPADAQVLRGDSASSAVAFDPYMNPEFTKLLIEHMHRAKIAALRDAEE